MMNESSFSRNTSLDDDAVMLSFGSLKRLIRESILNESAGKNEHDVALNLYNALNRNAEFRNCPGMLVDENGNITYNGHFYKNAERLEKIDKNKYFVRQKPDSKQRMYSNSTPGE